MTIYIGCWYSALKNYRSEARCWKRGRSRNHFSKSIVLIFFFFTESERWTLFWITTWSWNIFNSVHKFNLFQSIYWWLWFQLEFNCKFILKIEATVWRWWGHTPLITALGRQRQTDLCKFETSLVYKANSRTARAVTQRNPVLKQTNRQTKTLS